MKDDIIIFVFIAIFAQAEFINNMEISSRCQCMEYWDCFRSGGNFSNYCGLNETKVCCRLIKNRHKIRSLQSNCGQKGKDSGKIGFAEPTEWPWHVAILEKANHIYICGASLIDENWVLTAAHCVQNFVHNGVKTITARLGEYNVRTNEEAHRHQEYDIAEVVLHPQYNNKTLRNDLALLRLRFPVERRPNIDVVCLPKTRMDFERKNCFVTGWGRRNVTDRHSEVLKEVQVPIWPQVRCQYSLKAHFGNDYILPAGVICAGAEGNDACDGDGGGPLVCEDAGQWFQVGIVSYGLGCGEKDTPGIYTKIVHYAKWISTIIYFNLYNSL